MNNENLKCYWCWWARINKENKLICENHTPNFYGKDVTNKDSCYLFINVNEL